MGQQGSVEKKYSVEEGTPLPTRSELKHLLEALLPANEEMDEVSASIVLERAGVDLGRFAEGFRSRLEKRVAEMEVRGENVSQALVDTLRVLTLRTKEQNIGDTGEVPDRMRRTLAAGNMIEANQPDQVQASRLLLNEDDLRTLNEISAELQGSPADQKK